MARTPTVQEVMIRREDKKRTKQQAQRKARKQTRRHVKRGQRTS